MLNAIAEWAVTRAVRLVRSEDREDLYQEIRIKLWKLSSSGRISCRQYANQVAANVVRDHLRRQRRIDAMEVRVTSLDSMDPESEEIEDRTVEIVAARLVLDQAVLSMNPRAAEVFVMKESGYSHREISERLGMTIFTSKSLLERGMRGAANLLDGTTG